MMMRMILVVVQNLIIQYVSLVRIRFDLMDSYPLNKNFLILIHCCLVPRHPLDLDFLLLLLLLEQFVLVVVDDVVEA